MSTRLTRLLGLLILTCGLPTVVAEDLTRKIWWPSEFGPTDQLGAANRLNPAKVLQAAALIKTGVVVDMTHVVDNDMPLFSLTPYARQYRLVIPGSPTYGPMGENALVWNEDYLAGELTQNGTQFDALAHMGTVYAPANGQPEVRYYNGYRQADIADAHGFKKLGVEQVPPIFTRGILIDIASAIAPRKLDVGDAISVADLQAALARQGMREADIEPGDALFINTGWGAYWHTDKAKFNRGIPGLSPAAGDWVVTKKVLLVGTDNWGVEAIPDQGGRLFAPNHQKFLVENGIYIMENIDFSGLVQRQTYRFAFAFGAIPFRGATGSPARPMAIF
jgi:kynurenine formamidase